MGATTLTIVAPGPLATVQDLGRGGYAHLGVPRSGAADRAALRLANRLVGNPESAAAIETTMGGFRMRADGPVVVAVTGPPTTVSLDGVGVGYGALIELRAGAELGVAPPPRGLRNYIVVRGGIDVEPVLGSRSTDTLSGLGPPPLHADMTLPVGEARDRWPTITQAPVDAEIPRVLTVDVGPGPRIDFLADPDTLVDDEWTVEAASNRIGVRLDRPADSAAGYALHHTAAGELPSEGVPHGGVQVPPSGRPVIFLADHPVTGGYPVVAVIDRLLLDRIGQLTAGDRVRFRLR